jgi:hypothetical protein
LFGEEWITIGRCKSRSWFDFENLHRISFDALSPGNDGFIIFINDIVHLISKAVSSSQPANKLLGWDCLEPFSQGLIEDSLGSMLK